VFSAGIRLVQTLAIDIPYHHRSRNLTAHVCAVKHNMISILNLPPWDFFPPAPNANGGEKNHAPSSSADSIRSISFYFDWYRPSRFENAASASARCFLISIVWFSGCVRLNELDRLWPVLLNKSWSPPMIGVFPNLSSPHYFHSAISPTRCCRGKSCDAFHHYYKDHIGT